MNIHREKYRKDVETQLRHEFSTTGVLPVDLIIKAQDMGIDLEDITTQRTELTEQH